ncbi:hypothetical protein AGABI1DRAFT_59597 [Agaricus bisporus var. burnettii JB137-S8]|uniref:Arrestin-like N-terminal domain-containing protein n=1 Tax=Agaricus bisporus var. burnettii (strain JB137-S8 / ATCC MYA-4627 / FGSC 10392) TaxID=597362 RepID=K5X646_AGABU|nr:uncharacterized protein AGABI1DRAFT_59597 [Agaricus bisporus var. burnettii JB137-S8]EKM78643.1 hypothetical protein AGABI1DRAFT_59597 [Agaricus bisporus var. burnettii JB137-S8]
MNALAPPSYRASSTRSGQAPASTELPPYSRRYTLNQPVQVAPREPTEHTYQINDGKVVLKIHSSAKSSKSLPTFFEKENIRGQLTIDAEKGDSIHAIYITITGRVVTGSSEGDSFIFLRHNVPVWSRASDAPRLPSSSQNTTGTKLLGNCIWPLSIAIPRTVKVATGTGDTQECRLPETFLERHTRVSVQYDLKLHISRGKLRASSEIKTAFGFISSTRPDPPSLLRQLAYQQGCPLPNPQTDPDGWKPLGPVSCRGVMSKSRKIETRCTLAIAKPLCFTRGTAIPCCLTIEGTDSEALDILARPSSIVLSLQRRVRFYNQTYFARPDVAWNESVDEIGTACWWPSQTMASTTHRRQLEGEIHLSKDLRPSSDMGHFGVAYSVVLSPFNAPGFKPSSSTELVCEPVEIATMHARGPRAVPLAPPAYDPAVACMQSDDVRLQMPAYGLMVV